jgi:hypothetical protein
MTRHRMTFVFAAALLALTALVSGAAPDPEASIFTAKPALCKADLTPAQQAPSKLLGVPAPKPRTCQEDCRYYYKACRAACSFDEQCLSDCQDQYEYCICGGCGYCP